MTSEILSEQIRDLLYETEGKEDKLVIVLDLLYMLNFEKRFLSLSNEELENMNNTSLSPLARAKWVSYLNGETNEKPFIMAKEKNKMLDIEKLEKIVPNAQTIIQSGNDLSLASLSHARDIIKKHGSEVGTVLINPKRLANFIEYTSGKKLEKKIVENKEDYKIWHSNIYVLKKVPFDRVFLIAEGVDIDDEDIDFEKISKIVISC